MRILLVASKYLPEYTGAAYRLHALYKGLLAANPDWSLEIICGGIEQDGQADYELDGIPVHRLRSRAPTRKSQIGRLAGECLDAWEAWSVLQRRPCDLVHTIGMSPVIAGAINWARRNAKPLLVEVVTEGAIPDQGLPLLGRIRLPDLRQGTGIVAISKPLGEICRERGYDGNVWVRPNPVDTSRFYPEPKAKTKYRKQLTAFAPDDIVITSVASFIPRKNQIFLIDVLSRLDDRFKLVLAGPRVTEGGLAARDKAYFQEIEEKIAAYNLGERVLINTEFVKTNHYIKASDIFVMPATSEGFGTPILESQACAVPVIANGSVPAFREYIHDGKTGFIPPLDADAWVQSIHGALKLDKADLLNGSAEIREHFSYDATLANYEKILNALASLHPDKALDVGAALGSASQ